MPSSARVRLHASSGVHFPSERFARVQIESLQLRLPALVVRALQPRFGAADAPLVQGGSGPAPPR